MNHSRNTNVMEAAEAPIISVNEKENEEENYLPKTIIAGSIIINENKPTDEKMIAILKEL
jgi:hypothetical protein